jgi:acetyltransferase-like isoleucine patch superfamily enzyme
LGDEVMVGAHAVVLPRVKVGARATIGAGSVVARDVPEGASVAGAPATLLK